MFIVQGKPRKPEGIIKVIKETRQEALEAARDLLDNGMVIVTIIADGRVYTVEEFALTISNQMRRWQKRRGRQPEVASLYGFPLDLSSQK